MFEFLASLVGSFRGFLFKGHARYLLNIVDLDSTKSPKYGGKLKL